MDANPGDLVVCVVEGMVPCGGVGSGHDGSLAPPKGFVGKVDRVERSRLINGEICGCLDYVFCGGERGLAPRFRKLNDEPDNAELIAKIKRCTPARIGEVA